jgi:hypothetical protein
MFARLLACFALLSGLAAVTAPAQANYVGALGTQLERSQKQSQPAAERRCHDEQTKRASRMANRPSEPCPRARPTTVFIPTVQLGSDFALE